MKIPVIVVDDEKVDRYVARRRLSKVDVFGDVIEAQNGQEFIDNYMASYSSQYQPPPPILVLMDVNMPGMDGFETVARLQEQLDGKYSDGEVPVVVMIFTSSDNPRDKQRASELELVKGYIVKPLDESAIARIRDIYGA